MVGRDYAHATYRQQQERAARMAEASNLQAYHDQAERQDRIAWCLVWLAIAIGGLLLSLAIGGLLLCAL